MRNLMMIALLAGCSGADDPSDSGTADDTGNSAFQPTTGTWYINGMSYALNTCGWDETPGEEPEGTWQLTQDDDGHYTILVADYLADFHCSLDDHALVCEELLFEGVSAGDGIDATLEQTFSLGMSYDDANTGTGSWGMVQTCSGTECDGLDCESQVSGGAAHAGE